MIINYNKEQLSCIINDIFDITGISISILDTDFNYLARRLPKENYCHILQSIEDERKYCSKCDQKILKQCLSTKKLESHICRTGLCDSAMPIIKYDTIVGFVIMGQVRSEKSPALPLYCPNTDDSSLRKLEQLYTKIPILTEGQLSGLYDLLPRILFDNAIEIVYDSFVNKAVEYINTNLQENLSVSKLCEEFHISKNYLYKAFRNNLGTTVTEYINEQRIQQAKKLLEQSHNSVYQIGEMVGIYNYTYFCQLFKKLIGMTPTQYRKRSPI